MITMSGIFENERTIGIETVLRKGVDSILKIIIFVSLVLFLFSFQMLRDNLPDNLAQDSPYKRILRGAIVSILSPLSPNLALDIRSRL